MKKAVSLVLFPMLALGIFVGINAFMSSASGNDEDRYNCDYYGDHWECNVADEEGDFLCGYVDDIGWSCRNESWESTMSCEEYGGGEGEEEGGGTYLSCEANYRCTENGDSMVCTIDKAGSDSCYDGEGGISCYVNEMGKYLYFCGRDDEGYHYYCDKGYSISEGDSLYYFVKGWGGDYYCQGMAAVNNVGVFDNTSKSPNYEWGYESCRYIRGGDRYSYCKEEEGGDYSCPKLYDIDNADRYYGEYNLELDPDGEWYCEKDENGVGTCYNVDNKSKYYDNCTEEQSSEPEAASLLTSSIGGYSCPITYSCTPEDGGSLCNDDIFGDYYCRVNNDYETYSCFLGGQDTPLSNKCTVYEGEEGGMLLRGPSEYSFPGFFCPENIETHTITFSVNPNAYGSIFDGSVVLDGDKEIPAGLPIVIDENKKLTIGDVEVIATPAESTPEYEYSFSGWTNTCGDTLTQDCTITANFSRTAKEYTITFKDGDRTYVYTGAYGSNVSVTAPNWQKEGYSLSWEGTIPTTMPAENIVITAQWTINQYTITFNPNGGEGVFEPITQDYNTNITEPEDPIRTGYTFVGWYDGVNKVTFPYPVKKTTTLTAHWSNNSGSSGYSGGGGSSRGSSKQEPSDKHNSADDDKNVETKSLPNNDTTKQEVESKDDSTDTQPQDGGSKNGGTTVGEKAEQYTKETTEAYTWAFTEGLTKYNNISDARMGDFLNRSEMAKITTIFATKFRGETPDENKKEFCSKYSDLWKVEEDTKEYIIQSCELGYMGYQANGVDALERFRPYTPVSVAEVSIILSRLMWGNRYAVSENKWYQGHLWAVYEHRLIDNISKPFNDITRKDAFTMLYRLSSSDILRD